MRTTCSFLSTLGLSRSSIYHLSGMAMSGFITEKVRNKYELDGQLECDGMDGSTT